MKVLVDAATLQRSAPRMSAAAAGLALRGHAVEWAGAPPPAGMAAAVHAVGFGLGLARRHADVVAGSSAGLARATLGGLLSRANALVVDLDPRAHPTWSALERWAWDALYGTALVDGAAADAARATLTEDMQARVALWPDAAPPPAPDPAHADVEVLERACERALARHRSRVPRAAVFLDRDGTLVVEREYLDDPAGIELLPGVAGALRGLRLAGFALVVVSNQSGVGRGRFTLRRVHEVMAALRRALRAQGVELDAIYFCPHRPDEGCPCRKPGTALLERAAEDLQLDLSRSVMVGDKRLDAEAGQRAGGAGVLVRTGYGHDESRGGPGASGREPDAVVDGLAEAARWILGRHERLPS